MDVIVATASLEVGFNDPGVGSVIQHKAPRDVAQFLQRKGRAGRLRSMRPWTVVVLSDYGRDQLAYQAYDQLFDPELPVRTVPLANRYVQRMQAVYSLIDFLGASLQAKGANGNVWQTLAGPSEGNRNRAYREALVASLAAILRSAKASDDLEDHLQQALGLTEADVMALLLGVSAATFDRSSPYRAPPAVLIGGSRVARETIILPNSRFRIRPIFIVQRLEPPRGAGNRPWHACKFEGTPGGDAHRPGTLDICRRPRVAEVWYRRRTHSPVDHSDVDKLAAERMLDLGQFYTMLPLGTWLVRDHDVRIGQCQRRQPVGCRVNSPHLTSKVTPRTRVSNCARKSWPCGAALCCRSRRLTKRSGYSSGLEALTHAQPGANRNATVCARIKQADIRFKRRDASSVRFQHMLDGQPAALGFVMPVDGLPIRIAIPPDLWAQGSTSDAKWRALRTTRFFGCRLVGRCLVDGEKSVRAAMACPAFLPPLSYEALYRQIGLQEAEEALAAGTAAVSVTQVLNSIFQSPLITDDQAGDGSDGSAQDSSRH